MPVNYTKWRCNIPNDPSFDEVIWYIYILYCSIVMVRYPALVPLRVIYSLKHHSSFSSFSLWGLYIHDEISGYCLMTSSFHNTVTMRSLLQTTIKVVDKYRWFKPAPPSNGLTRVLKFRWFQASLAIPLNVYLQQAQPPRSRPTAHMRTKSRTMWLPS